MSDAGRGQSTVEEVLRILSGLPGIVAVKQVDGQTVEQVVELERRYEQGALVPLKNLGVRIAWKRDVAVGVIKDKLFREPPAPTVYLVEEARSGSDDPPRQRITVEGRMYRIVGEELLPSRLPYTEKTITLGSSFVIFPDRRSSDKTPSYFLVPPLGFPELETIGDRLGIGGVISISPSAQADTLLRKACGFPPDPSLATLLVAFNLRLTGML